MKILYVLPFFSKEFGGSVLSTLRMAKDIQKRGNSVHLITSDYKIDEDLIKETEDAGIKIFFFKTDLNIASFQITHSLNKWLKKNITFYDIVHLNNYRTYQNIVVTNAARKSNVPYIIQARGSLTRIMGKKILKYIYDYLWGFNIIKKASRGYAFSEIEKGQYIDMGMDKGKVLIVPNYLNINEYEEIDNKIKNKECKDLVRYKNKIKVLFIGRIHRIKGLDILLKAIHRLNDPNVMLIIVGPDFGYLKKLKKMIKELNLGEQVLILGPKYGEEKYLIYKNSDIFAISSEYEAFPNTMLEACFFNNKIISTNRCMIHDIIRKIGIVTDHNPESFFLGIRKIIDRLNKKLNEKEFVIQYFNDDLIISFIIKDYYSLIKKKGIYNGA